MRLIYFTFIPFILIGCETKKPETVMEGLRNYSKVEKRNIAAEQANEIIDSFKARFSQDETKDQKLQNELKSVITELNDIGSQASRPIKIKLIPWLSEQGASAVPFLVKLLENQSEWVQSGALNGLGDLGGEAMLALPALRKYRNENCEGEHAREAKEQGFSEPCNYEGHFEPLCGDVHCAIGRISE